MAGRPTAGGPRRATTAARGPLDRLRRQAGDGTLTLRVAATYPAEQAPEAHLGCPQCRGAGGDAAQRGGRDRDEQGAHAAPQAGCSCSRVAACLSSWPTADRAEDGSTHAARNRGAGRTARTARRAHAERRRPARGAAPHPPPLRLHLARGHGGRRRAAQAHGGARLRRDDVLRGLPHHPAAARHPRVVLRPRVPAAQRQRHPRRLRGGLRAARSARTARTGASRSRSGSATAPASRRRRCGCRSASSASSPQHAPSRIARALRDGADPDTLGWPETPRATRT